MVEPRLAPRTNEPEAQVDASSGVAGANEAKPGVVAAAPKVAPSLRTGLASLLDRAGVVSATLFARRFVALPFLPIVTYHRIGDPTRTAGAFDRHVVDASAEAFERQVELLSRAFRIVGIDELRAYFYEGKALPPNPALITFDDGYRECHDVALPILLRHGARAVFFVATEHTENRRVFWWDRVSYLVKASARERIFMRYPYEREFDLRGDRAEAIARLLRVIKDEYALDLERFLTELADACEVRWTPADERRFADEMLMRWDDIRALRRAGMDVQSHTRTHRILQTLPPGELVTELRGSREELEAQLGEPVRALAYPVGRAIRPDPLICDAVRAAGYDLGFSNGMGTNLLRGPRNPFDIQRLAVDHDEPHAYFRAVLAVPMLAHQRATLPPPRGHE